MQLTEQQMNHYRTFGFLVFRQLLSPDEMETYNREFNAGLQACLQHGMHDEVRGTCVPLHDADTPFIASLLDDPRFADVAEQLLGRKVLGIWSDAAWRAGDTSWHTDQVTSKYKAVKFAIYPDLQKASDGALRVIPGSHLASFSTEINDKTIGLDPRARFGVAPDELPCYVFESQPGDVLAFGNPLWHSAFGGSLHRRMGVVMFTEDPQTPYEIENIQRIMYNMHRRLAANFSGQFYPDYWRKIDDPRHQYWVKRLAELDMLETPPASSYVAVEDRPYPVMSKT